MTILEPYQVRAVDWLSHTLRGIVVASAGSGKCLGRGTPVLLYCGRIVPVEKVKIGDRLMGPDSNSRTVTSVTHGFENLYRITPNKGENYVVNESHILSLKVSGLHPNKEITIPGTGVRAKNGEVVNVCVRDYLGLTDNFRLRLKTWRTGVDFQTSRRLDKRIPPYLLGAWLGDGNSNGPAFSTTDPELVTVLAWYALQSGLILREERVEGKCPMFHLTIGKQTGRLKSNQFRDGLNQLGVMNNKHIPFPYLTATRQDRLDVLAGLLDTDGHLSGGGFDYISKLEVLADGVCFLCRSLGLAAYKTPCKKTCTNNGVVGDYFRVSISGDCSIIPCRIPRKRAGNRRQKKSVLVSGISVSAIGNGEYFGFTLNGTDRLFLLGDFTVTHNTIIAAAALEAVAKSKPRTKKIRVGWLAHTIEQKQQAVDALNRFPELLPMIELKVECAAAEHSWLYFDVLVVDEVHWAGCNQWSKQVQSCMGARWGFTATPFGDDPERNAALLSLFDQQVFTIQRHEVSARLAPAKVVLLDASDANLLHPIDDEIERTINRRLPYWGGEDWKLRAIVAWQTCIKRGIIGNKARNAAAVTTAKCHLNDSVLMLVNEIEHGESLAKQIPGAVLCYSKMGKKDRREALAAFKAGEVRCLVATSLADEGLDIPIANVLVMVSAGKSRAKTEQRTGRVLRTFAGKEHGLIYDFRDTFHPMMARHAKVRQDVYRKLGYEFQP